MNTRFWRTDRPAPFQYSPAAVRLTSFSTITGRLSRSPSSCPRHTARQPRLGAHSTTPVSGSTMEGAPTTTHVTSGPERGMARRSRTRPASSPSERSVSPGVRGRSSLVRTQPLKSVIAACALVPRRSTVSTAPTSGLNCTSVEGRPEPVAGPGPTSSKMPAARRRSTTRPTVAGLRSRWRASSAREAAPRSRTACATRYPGVLRRERTICHRWQNGI